MGNDLAHYKVYVVRCWEEPTTQTTHCMQVNMPIGRFTLEIPSTGQRFGFTSLPALLNALGHRLSQDSNLESN